ncbi:MAG: hypothetical protein GY794_23660, partial [bacterium]|nr:hypothetical protein [bacterium]
MTISPISPISVLFLLFRGEKIIMPKDTAHNTQDVHIEVDGDAAIKGAAFGNENQIAGDMEKIGGHLVQAQDSDVHIG